MPTLLLIDDEPVIQHAFRKAFHPPEYDTVAVRTSADGLAKLSASRPDAIVLDIHLPDSDGLKTFDAIRALDPRIPVILITGHGTTELAIEAMKRGAFEYLLKPLRYETIVDIVDQACRSSRLMNVPARLDDAEPESEPSDTLRGNCPAIQDVFKQIGRVSATDATVLIQGESGTGKELVARAIYQHSKRVEKPFLAINCGAIPESLIESELFGHERGAFTGADRKRIGRFEQCRGGTLFLDEIGEMAPLAQVKLLRVLQEQTFERVGGTELIRSDVRILAATNADLAQLVADGRFRQDLYFRLNVFPIALPPLRERSDDIDRLTDYFVTRFGREFGKAVATVPDATRQLLRSYRWPGNVRELQSAIKQAILRMNGNVLLPDFLSIDKLAARMSNEANGTLPSQDWVEWVQQQIDLGTFDLYDQAIAVTERKLFALVLQKTGGNQLRAAEILGITRGTLRRKLRSLGLSVERTISAENDHVVES